MTKNAKALLILLIVAVGMVGFAYAFVPLYKLFCQMTGWDGTPKIYAAPVSERDARDRVVTVQFNGDVDRDLPWAFRPEQKRVEAQVGVSNLVSYEAINHSDKAITGTSVYNVTPEKAAKYFNKTQCFCFGLQTLEAGQRADFPIQFYIDPTFVDNPEMADVHVITLSYTFYEADSERLDAAIKAGYTSSQ